MALARGLQGAGYDVRVATHRRFESLVRSAGVDFFPMAGDPREILQSDDGRRWVEERRNPLRALSAMMGALRPAVRQILDDHWEAARDADVVLYHGLSRFAGYSIGEQRGIPAYPAQVLPSHAFPDYPRPTGEAVARMTRAFNRSYNRARVPIGQALFWQFARPIVNDWRRERLGLPPLPSLSVSPAMPRVGPWLYGFSEHVIPRPPHWSPDVHLTGFWFLDRPADWQPPADLVAFLEGGPPPIYIGFGSMVTRDPRAELAMVLDAVGRSGRRAVLVAGYGGLDGQRVPDEVFVTPWVPFDWLFPRMAAAVHHGGCGTTALSLRAGLPTVTVPFYGDQRLWASRVAALGAGPRPIPHAELTAERLAAAIHEATGNAALRERAQALGERLRAEDGVARAVDILDRDIRHQSGRASGETRRRDRCVLDGDQQADLVPGFPVTRAAVTGLGERLTPGTRWGAAEPLPMPMAPTDASA